MAKERQTKRKPPSLAEEQPLNKTILPRGRRKVNMREEMTRNRMEQYTSLRCEIAMLEENIYNAQMYGNEFVTDVVDNSGRPLVIKGYGSNAIPRLCKRKAELEAECSAVEKYIEAIDDSDTRQLLTRRFIEDRTVKETASLVGFSEKHTSKLINDFFRKLNT
jgi:DNA-directed RNA polymerase specialized sigma subunit